MTLVKFAPAVLATLVLAACSTAEKASPNVQPTPNTSTVVTDTVSKVENAVSTVAGSDSVRNTQATVQSHTLATHSKSVVYRCLNKKTVTATYAFDGETPKAVNLLVGDVAINGLGFDTQAPDGDRFHSDKYSWDLDLGFSYKTIETKGAMLTQYGKGSDEILAKLCKVDKRATKRINMK